MSQLSVFFLTCPYVPFIDKCSLVSLTSRIVEPSGNYHPHRVPGRERRTIVLKDECGSDAKQTKDSPVVCRASVVNSQLYYVSRMLIGTSHDDKEGSLLSWEIPLSFSVALKKRTLFSGKTTHLKENLP